MKNLSLISLLLFSFAASTNAQQIDVSEHPDKHPYLPLFQQNLSEEDYIAFLNSLSVIKDRNQVKWECLGPDYQPEELNPGGVTLSTSVVNRGNGTGRVNMVYVDPYVGGRLFACSPTGGLFISHNYGRSWINAGTDQLPISGVASVTTDPLNPNRWWIVTGDADGDFAFSDGVWRTEDAGVHWVNISGSGSRSIPISKFNWEYTRASDIAVHPLDPNLIFLATNKGLYCSKNATASAGKVRWKLMQEGWFYDIEILPWNKETIIAAGDRLCISTSRGRRWRRMPSPSVSPASDTFVRINVEISPADPDVLHCGVASRDSWEGKRIGEGTYQRFNLKTRTWQQVRSLKNGMNNYNPSRGRAFAVSPTDPDLILTGNIQPVYRSEDGGFNFSPIKPRQMHDDIHDISFSENGETIWASHDGGVSVSYDGGETWKDQSLGLGVANVFGVATARGMDKQVLFGAYDTGGNLLIDNKWWHTNFGDGFECIIHADDPAKMVSTSQNGNLYKAEDSLWFGKVRPHGAKVEWHTWIRSDPFDADVIYLSGNKISRSSDFGASWESILQLEEMDPNYSTVYTLYPSETHPGLMFAYVLTKQGNHVLLRTENCNASAKEVEWSFFSEVPVGGWLTGLAFNPGDPRSFFLAMGGVVPGGKLWYHDGTRFQDISGNLGYSILDDMIYDPMGDVLYLGSSHGVWYMRGNAPGQFNLMDGLPGTFVRSLAINDVAGKLVVGTFGRGIWQTDLLR